MSSILGEILLILLLTLINGILSMSELAVVSARKVRLQQRADIGDAGAKAALKLAEDPGQFLSTVQIGITLVGILAGALGGANIAEKLAEWIVVVPFLAPYANAIGVGIVVLVITYLSLVFGELTPKRLALNNAEGIASAVAPAMRILAQITAPFVHLLSLSSDLVLRLLHVKASSEPAVTDEDVRSLLEQGAQMGIFDPIEEEIVEQVFRLSDRTVSALLTPRTDIVWLDVDDDIETIKARVLESGHSFFPVAEDNLDNVLGLVSAKALLAQSLAGQALDLRSALQPALFLPETTPALVVVERLKQTHSHMAMVIDEYGGLEGLVTLDDILEAIVGDMPSHGNVEEAEAMQREDGSWLLDGMFQVDEFKALFEIKELPDEAEGYYQTVGGFVMAMLGRIPAAGDHFEWQDYRLEVMDMDGRRVDKVLVVPLGSGARS